MTNNSKYKIVSIVEPPPRKYGRTKSINNDDALVKRALIGLWAGDYKNYGDAATQLALEAKVYGTGKKPAIDSATIIDRLRRKISKAYNEQQNA